MRAGRLVGVSCLAAVVTLIVAGWNGGLVFGVPLPTMIPVAFGFGLAALMAYLFFDSLRHGLIFTRSGIIERQRHRAAYFTYLALIAALLLFAGGAAVFLVIYSRANPSVV